MLFDTLDFNAPTTNSFGDVFFSAINKNAFQNSPANTVFTKTYQDTFETDKQLYIIVGSDSGLLLPFLEKQATQGKAKKFVVFDHPKMVNYLQQKETPFDHVTLLSSETDFKEINTLFPDYVLHNRMQLIRSLAVLDHTNPYYEQLWEDLLIQFRLLQLSQSAVRQNSHFINSQLYNLADNLYPVALLQAKFKKAQAVILGGGPTLDAGIEWIKNNKDNLVIFAAGRITERLLKEKIFPDFIVTVDPNDVSYDNTKKMALLSDKSILIHTNYAHHSLLAEWSGTHCFTDAQYPWAEPSQPDNLATSGPTVTNTIASIAAFLGFDEIYLLGVDFCYSQTGQTHESSSLEKNLGKFVHEIGQKVETYSGRLADTNDTFAEAAESMNKFAKAAKDEVGIQIFNLGYEAAKLDNVPYIAFKDIHFFTQVNQKQTLIDEVNHLLQLTPEKVQRHLKQSKTHLQTFRKKIKSASTLASEGLDAASQLFDKEQKVDALTQKITKAKNKLNKNHLNEMEFIFNYAISAYADFMDPTIDQEDDMSEDQIKTNLMDFFKAITETAEDFLVHLDKGIKNISHRQQEKEGEKVLQKLIPYWKAQNEEGRILSWLKLYQLNLADFSPKNQQAAQQLIEIFNQKIASSENSKLAKRLREKEENLTTPFKLVEDFFQEKDIEKMQEMIEYLATKESFKGIELQKLAQGYLLEMQEKFQEALETYVSLEDKTLLHKGLKQVVQISLNLGNYQNALNALEVLIEYSDEYLIMYADLLSAMGDKPGAVQIYVHYLLKHEDDQGTRIKLAKTLLSLNLIEDCLRTLDEVLKANPDDVAAKLLKEEAQSTSQNPPS